MRASLDTNVIIHFYKAGLQDILFTFFDEGVFIYEQIRGIGLENHGQEVLAQIDADYNSIGKIQYICSETDIDILKTEYTENVYMEMIVQAENYGQFVQKITEAFSGKISVVKIQQQKFGKSESGEVILLS